MCKAKLAARPTPHLAGKPDLNGTWDHLGGIEFVRPEKLSDGSICLRGCAPSAAAAITAESDRRSVCVMRRSS